MQKEDRELICAVCEFPMQLNKPAYTETYAKVVYPFCGKDCLKSFMEDPEKYRQFDEEEAE